MDILFKNDDFVFSYRVGGILTHKGKILLQRPKNDDYAIIGGHVAAMETSMETLKREFEEEIHAKIEVDNLLAIGEIYFPSFWKVTTISSSCSLSKTRATIGKFLIASVQIILTFLPSLVTTFWDGFFKYSFKLNSFINLKVSFMKKIV